MDKIIEKGDTDGDVKITTTTVEQVSLQTYIDRLAELQKALDNFSAEKDRQIASITGQYDGNIATTQAEIDKVEAFISEAKKVGVKENVTPIA